MPETQFLEKFICGKGSYSDAKLHSIFSRINKQLKYLNTIYKKIDEKKAYEQQYVKYLIVSQESDVTEKIADVNGKQITVISGDSLVAMINNTNRDVAALLQRIIALEKKLGVKPDDKPNTC